MKDKVAIVTGAGRGIGQGIAAELAKAGWRVVINDISPEASQEETLDLVRQAGSEELPSREISPKSVIVKRSCSVPWIPISGWICW